MIMSDFLSSTKTFVSENVISLVFGGGIIGLAMLLKRLNILYRWMHKADPKSTRHGGELVANVLKAHGVQNVFTLVGGHISPILVACENIGIRVVDTRHEVTAVFAADAVARLSGTVGVAAVTAGPGLTNTVTAIKNAQMAESPLLLIGGAAASLLKGRGALQDIDQMSLFKPLCKFCGTAKTVREIVPLMKKALQIAQSGTPGPVFMEFPIDVLYPYDTVQSEVTGAGGTGKGLVGSIVSWYLNSYLTNVFAGAFEPRDPSPLKVYQPMASSSQVNKCVQMLSKAKNPLIVMGSQATLPPVPAEELGKALQALGIPCFLGGMSRGLLGKNSPIHARQCRKDALREADVVILAGAVCDFRLGYGRSLSRRSKIVAVNRNKEQLTKSLEVVDRGSETQLQVTEGVKIFTHLTSDAASFLMEVAGKLKGYKVDQDWVDKLRQRDVEKEKKNLKMADDPTDVHLNPLKVLHQLEDILPENSILVADGGDFVATASYILRPRGPLKWLDPGAFGTLGVGGGFALGAKLSRPDCEVWIIYGDGSLGYSVAEFDTYTRHKIPVLALVGNDACWTQIARDQIPRFKSAVACNLAYTPYHEVAQGFGGKGYLLDNASEIKNVMEKAQKDYKDGQSVLINCLIGKTTFREGSISV